MTDKKDSKERGSIISSSDILLHDAETALMYEELRAAIDDGHESMTHADALAEIAAIRAENVELRAQLESIGAGGVSGPLMGQPQEMPDLSALTERGAKAWAGVDAQGLRDGAASAGSEPVAYAMFADNGNIRLWSKARIPHPGAKPLYLHPSTPEGMVGGWISVEDARKPQPGKPVVLWVWGERYQEDDDGRQIAQDASGLHLGEWREAEHGNYFDNYSTPFADREAVLWWMDPNPPTTSAGSRKGE